MLKFNIPGLMYPQTPALQPIINIHSGTVDGYELLLRNCLPDGSFGYDAVHLSEVATQDSSLLDMYVLAMLESSHCWNKAVNEKPLFINLYLSTLEQHINTIIPRLIRLHQELRAGMVVELNETSYTEVSKQGRKAVQLLSLAGIDVVLDDVDNRHKITVLRELEPLIAGAKVSHFHELASHLRAWFRHQRSVLSKKWLIVERSLGHSPFSHQQSNHSPAEVVNKITCRSGLARQYCVNASVVSASVSRNSSI